MAVDTGAVADSFRGRLLRHRERTGLARGQLAARLGVSRRTVHDWEAGLTYPSAERLQRLIAALLEAGGLSPGREADEARALWAVVERAAPRMHTQMDQTWLAELLGAAAAAPEVPGGARPSHDWGEAPDTAAFVGRTDELHTLQSWVLEERCRLLAILGMGGIGKTSLAARLAHEVAPAFERLYWRSLRDAPPPSDWLAGAIGCLSDHQVVPPARESERLTLLLQLLRERRCLLVLDNFETLFEPGQPEGPYRPGLDGYGRLLLAVGEAAHQSCLILTSREAPEERAVFHGGGGRAFHLGGLDVVEAQVLLGPKQLLGNSAQWAELVARVGGNGLALKVVGERIRELFGGDLGSFLDEPHARSVFGDMWRLLFEQIERSSAPEQQVLRVLALAREPVPLPALLAALGPRVGRVAGLEAIEALRRRSLIERAETPGVAAFTLQSVVLEYATERLVATAADEIERGQPVLLVEQPLIRAQAKDYVRQAQERLIGAAVLRQVLARHDEGGAEQRLLALLDRWRGRPAEEQGAGPGTVVNLLRLLRGHLRGVDLARLSIQHAYLAEVEAQDADLHGARLAGTALADDFSLPMAVALSGDGTRLAAGTACGEVRVWQTADRTLLLALQAHVAAVYALAFSADGRVLASGDAHGALRLWDAQTGRLLGPLLGQVGGIQGLALSADGHLLASGGTDGVVRVWDTSTGRRVATLHGHVGGVWGVAVSAGGHLVASAGTDGIVRLWDTSTGHLLAVLRGHTGGVRRVALSANGRHLASAGEDGTVRLWDTHTDQPLATLQGHASGLWGVALSAGGDLLASAGEDGTVRLWDAIAGRPIATLQGHVGGIWSVALSADGHLVASGGTDRLVRLWDAASGQLVAALHGHTNGVRGVAMSADGRLVASGSWDKTLRLWDAEHGRPVATLTDRGFGGVSLSADGQRLAAYGPDDGTLQLWDTRTARLLTTWQGHPDAVWSVALSADGHVLASGSADGTLRVWEVPSGRHLATWHVSPSGVSGVALAADGQLLASTNNDGTLALWTIGSAQPVAVLHGHTSGTLGVAVAADGRLLASGDAEGIVRLWDVTTRASLATLHGHTGAVWSVALSADGHRLASASWDGTVRLWATSTGTALCTLRPERRYERLDITGLEGITAAQRAALLALGAREQA